MAAQRTELADLISAANDVASEAERVFGGLSVAQLNWKPSSDRWSVAQCFDHLITTNTGYFPVVENALAGKRRTFWESLPLLPGLTGKMLIKSLDPASTRKIKAPKKFQPARSDIRASVIDDFVANQAQVVEKMQASERLDLERTIVTSPIAAPITYSLMDAFRIIVVHERRHFQQAKRVTEDRAFPK
jgi:hypothetical protein